MDDLSCRCSYIEPHMSLQGNEVLRYLPRPHPLITKLPWALGMYYREVGR